MRVEITRRWANRESAEYRDVAPGGIAVHTDWLADGATVTIRAAEPALQPGMVVRVLGHGTAWDGHLGTVVDLMASGTVNCDMWGDDGLRRLNFDRDDIEPVTRWPDTPDPIKVGDRVELRHDWRLAPDFKVGDRGTVVSVIDRVFASVNFDNHGRFRNVPSMVPASFLRRIDDEQERQP